MLLYKSILFFLVSGIGSEFLEYKIILFFIFLKLNFIGRVLFNIFGWYFFLEKIRVKFLYLIVFKNCFKEFVFIFINFFECDEEKLYERFVLYFFIIFINFLFLLVK